MVFSSIYSIYAYVSSPLTISLKSLQGTKKFSWDIILYVLAWNWVFLTQYIFPAIRENTPATYSGFVLLVQKLYSFAQVQAPSVWALFTSLCLHLWNQVTRLTPVLWKLVLGLLASNWTGMRSSTADGWVLFTDELAPVVYEDVSRAYSAVINDFWNKVVPHIAPDIRQGIQRVSLDLLQAYAHVCKSFRYMDPQIIFDLCVCLPKNLTKALIFSFSRIIADIAYEGVKKSAK